MNKFLDLSGVSYLWSKIKELLESYVVPMARPDAFGGIKVVNDPFSDTPGGSSGNTLAPVVLDPEINQQGLLKISIPMASDSTPGLLKVGSVEFESSTGTTPWVAYDTVLKSDGVVHANVDKATEETFGVVKVGAGLEIDRTGTLAVKQEAFSWSNIQNKPDLALKSDISQVYRYKGSVADYDSLPADEHEVGDVWNVESTGMNYAWTGEGWDALGEIMSIESITAAEIDSITAG